MKIYRVIYYIIILIAVTIVNTGCSLKDELKEVMLVLSIEIWSNQSVEKWAT